MKKTIWDLIMLIMLIVLYVIAFLQKMVLETEPGNFLVMTILIFVIMIYNKSEK